MMDGKVGHEPQMLPNGGGGEGEGEAAVMQG